eukprot:1411902-Pyramimonas_sp.AAC.2
MGYLTYDPYCDVFRLPRSTPPVGRAPVGSAGHTSPASGSPAHRAIRLRTDDVHASSPNPNADDSSYLPPSAVPPATPSVSPGQ